jgi:hypothetical protein
MPPNPEFDSIRQIAAGLVDMRCQLLCLRLLVLKTIEQTNAGILIDGAPPTEWFDRARILELEHELLHLADEDVTLASYVRKILSDLKSGAGGREV